MVVRPAKRDYLGPSFVYSAAGSYNGSTHPSGGCYLGPNPSPAALQIIESKPRSMDSVMKQVEFVVGKNTLKGALFFPDALKEKNPAILFIHGWTGKKLTSYQYAKALAKLGYISLLFDLRGHGESEGDINTATTKEFLDDVLAAYDYLRSVPGVDQDNISVVGSSYGGYLGSMLTAKRKVKRLALRVPADYANDLFNQSKMKTTGKTTSEIFAWRAVVRKPPETFALEAISHFDGDVLIIEAEKDDVVHFQTLHNYRDAIKNQKKVTYVIMNGASHSARDGSFRDQIENILVAWFKDRSAREEYS